MKISIITASYNYENYIKETIQSVIDQTYQDWEMIIVDDDSKDNSVEIIKTYCDNDKRIKLYTHENNENKGLSQTIQLGLSKAQGEWIIFLESDDILTPDYIEKKLSIINQNKDVILIFNDCELFGDEDKISKSLFWIKKTRKHLQKQTYPKNMFHDFYTENKIFSFSSVMAKKEYLTQIDYQSPIPCLLDWNLWIQLSYMGKFFYLPEKLTKWRLHYDSYIQTSNHKSPLELQTKIYLNISKKYKDYSILFYIPIAHIQWYFLKYKRLCIGNMKKLIFNNKK